MGPQAMPARVRVGKDSRLQHLVRREANDWNDVGRRKGGLLDLGKVVFRITIQLQNAGLDQRIVSVGPDLG